MEPINMIIIYYSDKKLSKRLYFLEADMITIAQKLKILGQLKEYIH